MCTVYRVRCGGLRCHRVALPLVPLLGPPVCFQSPAGQQGSCARPVRFKPDDTCQCPQAICLEPVQVLGANGEMRFGMSCKAQDAAIARTMARICNVADSTNPLSYTPRKDLEQALRPPPASWSPVSAHSARGFCAPGLPSVFAWRPHRFAAPI